MTTAPQILTLATDPTFASGPDTGQPTRVTMTSGEQAQGMIGGARFPAAKFNWMLGTFGEHTQLLGMRAMQEWRRDVLPGALSVTFKFLLGVVDSAGVKSNALVALGKNLTPKFVYHRGTVGGFEDNSTVTVINPPDTACAEGVRSWMFGIAPNTIVRYTGFGGASSSYSTFASTISAVYYAPGSSTPYITAFTGGFAKSVGFSAGTGASGPAGLTAITAASGGTPGGEFADDGGQNVVFACSCTISGLTRKRILSSVDGGATWTSALTIAAGALSVNVVWAAGMGAFIATYEESAGVFKVAVSTNGVAWTVATTSSLAPNQSFGTLAAAGQCIAKVYGSSGIAYSFDLGASWRIVSLDVTLLASRVVSINNRFYVICGDGTILSSGALAFEDKDI
jgi:hypothetical protein